MTTINSQEEYDSVKSRLDNAMRQSCYWEDDLEKQYNEYQQMAIMSMIAYLEIQLRGFGKLINERIYEEIYREDSTGQLQEQAKIGFEYAKLCMELAHPVRKWEIQHKK